MYIHIGVTKSIFNHFVTIDLQFWLFLLIFLGQISNHHIFFYFTAVKVCYLKFVLFFSEFFLKQVLLSDDLIQFSLFDQLLL